MVPFWVWVLTGILLYTVLAVWLDRTGRLPSQVSITGPLTTIRTERGEKVIEALARKYKRFWRPWGDFGVLLGYSIMVGTAVMILFIFYSVLTTDPDVVITDPQDVLVIPGVNQFLPLEATPEIVLGLIIGLVIHEGGHAIYCRLADINIDSLGVSSFTLIPLGAFVEPDYEDQNEADRLPRVRMLCAGITNNIFLSLVIFAFLFLSLSHAFVPVAGVPVGGVYSDTPAETANIEQGDVITAIEGIELESGDDFNDYIESSDTETVTVEFKDGSQTEVTRELVVSQISGTHDGIESGDKITSVNGNDIRTESEFYNIIDGEEEATLEFDSGEDVTVQTGAAVSRISPGGSFDDAGIHPDDTAVITSIDNQSISSTKQLESVLNEYDPGDEISVKVQVDGESETHIVTLGGSESPELGVQLIDGMNGIDVTDFGIDVYPSELMADYFQGDGGLTGFLNYLVIMLFLPLIGALQPAIGYNFAGFVGSVSNFYTVTGVFSVIGSGAFVLFNALFWTAWINIQIGIFNCIPAFPLDGGQIFREAIEAVGDRLSIDNIEIISIYIVYASTLLCIAVFVAILFL